MPRLSQVYEKYLIAFTTAIVGLRLICAGAAGDHTLVAVLSRLSCSCMHVLWRRNYHVHVCMVAYYVQRLNSWAPPPLCTEANWLPFLAYLLPFLLIWSHRTEVDVMTTWLSCDWLSNCYINLYMSKGGSIRENLIEYFLSENINILD